MRSVGEARKTRPARGTPRALSEPMSLSLDPSSLSSSNLTRALDPGRVLGALGGSSTGLAGALGQGAASWLERGASFLGDKPTADAATLLPLVLQLLQALQQLTPPGAPASSATSAAAAPSGGTAGGASEKPGKSGKSGGKTTKLDGPGGFLWKPVSDSNGKLVVLLPPKLAGQAKSVEVQDASGKTLARGRYTGDANGGRSHFRFDKPGAAFGNDVRVVATLANGQKVTYPIENGAARND